MISLAPGSVPVWSPTGRSLAYLTTGTQGPGLAIRTIGGRTVARRRDCHLLITSSISAAFILASGRQGKPDNATIHSTAAAALLPAVGSFSSNTAAFTPLLGLPGRLNLLASSRQLDCNLKGIL